MKFNSCGECEIDCEVLGMQQKLQFQTVKDRDLNCDVILGWEFLTRNKIIVDVPNNCLTRVSADGEKNNIHIGQG